MECTIRFFGVLVALLVVSTGTLSAQHDFFPMHVGNTWTYSDSNLTPPDTFTVSIVDTQRIEGHLYYQFDAGLEQLVGGSLGPRQLYRKDAGGNVYVYNLDRQRECLRFYVADRPYVEDRPGHEAPGSYTESLWYDECAFFLDPAAVWQRESLGRLRGTLLGGAISVEGRQGLVMLLTPVESIWLVEGLGIVKVQFDLAYPRFLIGAVIDRQWVSGSTGTGMERASWGAMKQLQLYPSEPQIPSLLKKDGDIE
ncbi:MAG: hypothetical protein HY709_01490 [Candidatus Latescibacteria bacterium]|nr:hypothetical protein [Candidatus Latescibacterota bacterium]